ncbi:MAG: ribonuclease H-like domain-containing protein [Bauldia sp.]
MEDHVVVWDLETVPDLAAAARILGMVGHSDADVRAALGPGFPKQVLHRIACIGALVAARGPTGWAISALGAPHLLERSEHDLIRDFAARIATLRPQLVTFNGNGFDLPVLRYRALVNRVPIPGLYARPYFNRYTEDAVDLCDVLASFQPPGRVKLDELAKAMGLPGKPGDVDGSKVEEMIAAGRIADVAAYCESDVLNTYRIWLTYEMVRGALEPGQFRWSLAQAAEFEQRRTPPAPVAEGLDLDAGIADVLASAFGRRAAE